MGNKLTGAIWLLQLVISSPLIHALVWPESSPHWDLSPGPQNDRYWSLFWAKTWYGNFDLRLWNSLDLWKPFVYLLNQQQHYIYSSSIEEYLLNVAQLLMSLYQRQLILHTWRPIVFVQQGMQNMSYQ